MLYYAKTNNLLVSGGTDYHKNGEKITIDYNDDYFTTERLFNFGDWANIYNIDDIKDIGNQIKEV